MKLIFSPFITIRIPFKSDVAMAFVFIRVKKYINLTDSQSATSDIMHIQTPTVAYSILGYDISMWISNREFPGRCSQTPHKRCMSLT